ncbi:hypothetical protein NE237_019517 [Protea cynaroides]|uniref:protein-disulfide reductase n=1 Tax=Protea cynaroides TaxID=273540 RepID=A0A9Q0H8U0_9MAGN|nr:hypothetical protein NE237_019517 [Protea cynaroides]
MVCWKRSFLPELIEAYHEIKAKDDAFEVIFISTDKDQASFDEFFSKMPWLAHPFGDERLEFLRSNFKISKIPTAMAIGPTGKTIIKNAINSQGLHGADAYPFTEERLKEIEAKIEEKRNRQRSTWSYYCEERDFFLHPKCALEEDKEEKDGEEDVDADDGIDQASRKDGPVMERFAIKVEELSFL